MTDEEREALERLGEVIGLGAATAETLIDMVERLIKNAKVKSLE